MDSDKTEIEEDASRRNAQGDHHGKGHRPEEFDVMNPKKQIPENRRDKKD